MSQNNTLSHQMGETIEQKTERIASAMGNWSNREAAMAAHDEYWAILYKALEGCIAIPERARALLPTLLETLAEMDEIEREDADYKRRSAAAMRGWANRRTHHTDVQCAA